MFRVKTRKDIIIYNRKINIEKIKLTKNNNYFLKNLLYNSFQAGRNLPSSLNLSQNYHPPLIFFYVWSISAWVPNKIYSCRSFYCGFLIQYFGVGHLSGVSLSKFSITTIDIDVNNTLVTKTFFSPGSPHHLFIHEYVMFCDIF